MISCSTPLPRTVAGQAALPWDLRRMHSTFSAGMHPTPSPTEEAERFEVDLHLHPFFTRSNSWVPFCEGHAHSSPGSVENSTPPKHRPAHVNPRRSLSTMHTRLTGRLHQVRSDGPCPSRRMLVSGSQRMFLTLPAEIRTRIYDHVLIALDQVWIAQHDNKVLRIDLEHADKLHPAILATCKHIDSEAPAILYRPNTFVFCDVGSQRISTPALQFLRWSKEHSAWSQAARHSGNARKTMNCWGSACKNMMENIRKQKREKENHWENSYRLLYYRVVRRGEWLRRLTTQSETVTGPKHET